MAEKYLGEQGLAKLIELVKKNSGGSTTYIKKRNIVSKKNVDTPLTKNTPHSFITDVYIPVGDKRPHILVQVWLTDNTSYSTFSQAYTIYNDSLWITEVYADANESSVNFYATLYYIGPDENIVNSGEMAIMNVKKLN